MMMMTASEAKRDATNKNGRAMLSVQSAVINAMSNGLLHCDYYTPVDYDCSTDDVNKLKEVAEIFQHWGFTVNHMVFPPNSDYSNHRVRLHLSWE